MIRYTVEMLDRDGLLRDKMIFPGLTEAAEFMVNLHKQALARDLKSGVDYNLKLKEYKG